MKKKIIAIGIITFLTFGISGCSEEYDKSEQRIVNVAVLRTERKSHWTGKFYTYDYNVYFDIGDGEELELENSKLFDLAKEGDLISLYRIDYIKDGKIVKSEFEFIN